MDPQQRLLLETVIHAVEHAGATFNRHRMGIYIGQWSCDYPSDTSKYRCTGLASSVASGSTGPIISMHMVR